MSSIIGVAIVICHVVLMICAFIGCYCTARLLGHLPSYGIPFISDTGVQTPEKYVFRQVLNTATITGICLIITRYAVVKAANEQTGRNRKIAVLSIISCVVGVLATYSLSLVANFPEGGDNDGDLITKTHTGGAYLLFIFGTVFATTDCVLTLLLRTSRGRNVTCRWCGMIRSILALAIIVNALIGVVWAGKAIADDSNLRSNDTSTNPSSTESPSETYYYNATAACEWIHSSLFLFYFLTFAPEFFDYSIELTASPRQNCQATHDDTTDQAAAASTAAAAAATTGGQVQKFAAPDLRLPTEHSPLLKTV